MAEKQETAQQSTTAERDTGPVGAKPDERAGFEKWANAKGTMGKSWNGQHYENILHESAWQAWQAGREHSVADHCNDEEFYYTTERCACGCLIRDHYIGIEGVDVRNCPNASTCGCTRPSDRPSDVVLMTEAGSPVQPVGSGEKDK